MVKKESSNIIWVILLIIIWTVISVRFMLRFYSFYYVMPIKAEFVGVFKDDKMFTSSLFLWLIWIIIWIIMLICLFKLKTNKNRFKLWVWAILFWLIINFLFYVINPWYTLQTHPWLFFYQDGKNITNTERYFFLTERYGFDSTLYKPFKTLEDSIEGLDFAKKINNKALYSNIFFDLEIYWYENIFNKYKDLTFQAYFLKSFVNDPFVNDQNLFDSNIEEIWKYKKYAKNRYIIEAINYIEIKRDEYKWKEKWPEFYTDLSHKVLDILKNLIWHWINNKILNI